MQPHMFNLFWQQLYINLPTIPKPKFLSGKEHLARTHFTDFQIIFINTEALVP